MRHINRPIGTGTPITGVKTATMTSNNITVFIPYSTSSAMFLLSNMALDKLFKPVTSQTKTSRMIKERFRYYSSF